MTNCIFCKIVAGELPANVVFENDDILAFKDIYPRAQVHILVIPKKHITSLAEIKEEDVNLVGRILLKISALAEEYCPNNEYRVETNIGSSWGQTVKHLHFHILGGKELA